MRHEPGRSRGARESVWLGFFLCDVLRQFATLATPPRRPAIRAALRRRTRPAGERLEAHAWDGAWYRRAYFDDGTPLGSAANTECQIDSIAQSWSVCRVWPNRSGRTARWMPWRPGWCALTMTGAIARPTVRPPRPNPATSAAMCRACARMAASNPTVRSGQRWPLPRSASRACVQLMDIINPLHHGRTASEVEIYKVEPTSSRLTSIACRRTPARAAGVGTPDRRAGCTGWRSNRCSACSGDMQDGARLHLTMPARRLAGFALDYRYRETSLPHRGNARLG